MKKSKKKLIYDDGGIIPNVDSPEYQAYMSWLKTESLKKGTLTSGILNGATL